MIPTNVTYKIEIITEDTFIMPDEINKEDIYDYYLKNYKTNNSDGYKLEASIYHYGKDYDNKGHARVSGTIYENSNSVFLKQTIDKMLIDISNNIVNAHQKLINDLNLSFINSTVIFKID